MTIKNPKVLHEGKVGALGTIIDTTSMTPPSLCQPLSVKKVMSYLQRLFRTATAASEAESEQPDHPQLSRSLEYMLDAVWSVGLHLYQFPEEAAPVIIEYEGGTFDIGFTYRNEPGSEMAQEGYVDPDFMDDIDDFVARLLEFAPKGMTVNPDTAVLSFRNKRALYELLVNLVEDESLGLVQPHEAVMTTPEELEVKNIEEMGQYLVARSEAFAPDIEKQDSDFLLAYAPMKPFLSARQYEAESYLACRSPLLVSLGHIYEMLLLEGEKSIPRHELGEKSYHSYGMN